MRYIESKMTINPVLLVKPTAAVSKISSHGTFVVVPLTFLVASRTSLIILRVPWPISHLASSGLRVRQTRFDTETSHAVGSSRQAISTILRSTLLLSFAFCDDGDVPREETSFSILFGSPHCCGLRSCCCCSVVVH